MSENIIDHEYTTEIVCPWCGYLEQESYRLDDDGVDECGSCGKSFHYTRMITVEYSTEPMKYATCNECGEKEKPVDNYNTYIGNGFSINRKDICNQCYRKIYRETLSKYHETLKVKYE